MKINIILISAFMFLFSINANAVITSLYRGDTRSPDEIFEKGFTAQGTNTDLVRHVLGLSTGRGGNSAFIPTSVNPTVPLQFARAALNTREFFYVYDIRPTDNIYFTSNALYTVYGYLNNFVPAEVQRVMSNEAEYSAVSYISPTQIRRVTAYTLNPRNQIVEAYTRDNPHYIEANTQINDGSNIPRTWATSIPNATPLMAYTGEATPAYEVPDDLSDDYRFWSYSCFGFASGFFK